MGIPWIILASIVVIGLQAWIYHWLGLKKIGYARSFNTTAAYSGESIEMVEMISNRKWLPLPWLRLESMIPTGLHFERNNNLEISEGQYYQNHKSLFSLMPYTKITRRHTITCKKRGHYRLHSATMTCGDGFGLFTNAAQLKLSAEVLVFPELISIDEIPLPSHSWQGDVTVRRWFVSDPFMVSGVREYRYGDSMNRINWKATSRIGQLQVHNEDFTAHHRLLVYVNFDLYEKMWGAVTEPETIEKALSYAASIVQAAILQGIEVGFGCNGYEADDTKNPVRIEPYSGSIQLVTILSAMARLVIARCMPFTELLEHDLTRQVNQLDYLILTAHMSDKLQEQINRLRSTGNSVSILTIQRENMDSDAERRRWAADA